MRSVPHADHQNTQRIANEQGGDEQGRAQIAQSALDEVAGR
jgi:hypothetical protein